MVQYLHDTVPYTAQVVTAGNPPGQTIKAAIDAGQALFFQMPYDLDLVSVPMLNGGTHTTGGGFFFRAESIAKRLKVQPGSVAGLFDQGLWTGSEHAAPAGIPRRSDRISSAARHDERDRTPGMSPVMPSGRSGMPRIRISGMRTMSESRSGTTW